MTCAQLRSKTRTSISRKICCVKFGLQIFYAIEQFSTLFSKDKLKRGSHIQQTHDTPSPRMSWANCRAVPSQQLPRDWHLKDSPWQERIFETRVFPRPAAQNSTRLGIDSRPWGEYYCDFGDVCVSLWIPAPVCFLISCVASYLIIWPAGSCLVSDFGLLSVFSPEWIRAPVTLGSTSVRA